MRKKSKKMRRVVFIGFLAIGILLFGINWRTRALAIFDPDTAVHINAASIDDSTLIIGTHLIYLGSLNDSVYAAAMTSAQESNQTNLYYKSELADGAWFDITDAGSLEDIMGNGMRVENELINALAVTHHTKADGITYDLRSNKKVSVFEIDNVYELETMPELEPLKIQFDRLKESDSDNEKNTYYKKIIIDFFRTTPLFLKIEDKDMTKVHTKITDEYDKQMQSLQKYYEILKSNGAASEETDAVLKVMDKLDATRRAAVYAIIGDALIRLTDKMQEFSEVDDTLLSAAEESKVNISDSQKEQEEKRLAAGTTVMSNMEYTLDNRLITEALQNNHSVCDTVVTDLISLNNIMDGKIVSKTAELKMATDLVARMDQVYKENLQRGIDDAYRKAVEARSSHVILENIINSNTVAWNVLRSELQFYVQAKIDRLENEEAQQYIRDRISSSGNFKIIIPMDAFQSSAKGTVETYVAWLQKLLKSVSNEGGTSELDRLYEEKAALQEEQMTALDQEDIREAKKAEAKIQAKAEEIKGMEEAAAAQLALLEAQKTTLEAKLELQTDDVTTQTSLLNQIADIQQQIADESSKLSDESTAQNIQNMKEEALKLVERGDVSGSQLEELSAYINGIGIFLGSGSHLALNAEKEIYKEMLTAVYLKEQTAYDDLMKQIEDKIENNMADQKSSTYTADAALAAIEDALGGSLKVNRTDKNGENTAGGSASGGAPGSGGSAAGAEGGVPGSGGSSASGGTAGAEGGASGSGGSSASGGTAGTEGGAGGSGGSGTGTGGGTAGSGGSGTGTGGSGTGTGGSGTGAGGSETGSGTGAGGSETGTGGGTAGSGGSGTESGGSGTGSGGSGTGAGGSGTGSGGSGTGAGGSETGSGEGTAGSGGSETGSGGSGTGAGGSETGSGEGTAGSGGSGTGAGGSETGSGESGTGAGGSGTGSGGSETGSGGSGTGSGGSGTGAGGSETGSGGSGTGSGGSGTGSGGSGTGSGGSGTGSGGSGTGSGGSGTGSGTGSEGSGTGSGGSETGSGGSGTGSGASGTGSGGSGTGSGGSGTGSEGSGTGSEGSGTGSGAGGSAADGSVTVEADSISQDDLLAAAAALAEYGDKTDSKEIKNLAAGLTASMMKEANAAVFEQQNSVNGKFAPASALAAYLNYRYLWNDTKKTAVVANGLTYYRFTAFHNIVEKNEEQTDTMSVEAEFRKTVYIPSDYLYEEFGCQVFHITGTDYAILIDDKIIEKQKELLEILQQP